MPALSGEPDSSSEPCVKLVVVPISCTPLPTCSAKPAPLSGALSESWKTSPKLIAPLLKAVVLALAMLLPVTPSDLELARRPDKAVVKVSGMIFSSENVRPEAISSHKFLLFQDEFSELVIDSLE